MPPTKTYRDTNHIFSVDMMIAYPVTTIPTESFYRQVLNYTHPHAWGWV